MVKVIEGILVLIYFLIVIGIGFYFKDRRAEDEYALAAHPVDIAHAQFAEPDRLIP
jgi:Na+/proline symporter